MLRWTDHLRVWLAEPKRILLLKRKQHASESKYHFHPQWILLRTSWYSTLVILDISRLHGASQPVWVTWQSAPNSISWSTSTRTGTVGLWVPFYSHRGTCQTSFWHCIINMISYTNEAANGVIVRPPVQHNMIWLPGVKVSACRLCLYTSKVHPKTAFRNCWFLFFSFYLAHQKKPDDWVIDLHKSYVIAQ